MRCSEEYDVGQMGRMLETAIRILHSEQIRRESLVSIKSTTNCHANCFNMISEHSESAAVYFKTIVNKTEFSN